MRVVLIGRSSLLGQHLAARLGAEHEVVPYEGDWRDPEAARAALAGADALLHLGLEEQARELPHPALDWRQTREAIDRAARGTFVLLNAAVAAGVRRVVLGSTLSLMARYPEHWDVTEDWRPRPVAGLPHDLAAYLAEISARELARVEPIEVVCLRFGEIVDDDATRDADYDTRWLHVEDAAAACRRALVARLGYGPDHSSGRLGHGWWLFHVVGGGRATRWPVSELAARDDSLGYRPTRDFAGARGADRELWEPPADRADRSTLEPDVRVPSRPIASVLVLGAGGPLASATAPLLAPDYRLRLADARSIDQIVSANAAISGQPTLSRFEPPHEHVRVDVRDYDQVLAACEGVDAVINCTVLRRDPVDAFLVNTIGAYHVMKAAVERGIRRVVHTGPLLVLNDRQAGYAWDDVVPPSAPPRPGAWLYIHSKFLGQELVRLFAEEYDLEAPTMLYYHFVDPRNEPSRIVPMTVSWEDAGHAMRRALEVPSLPSPFEVFHVNANLPHGKYPGDKAYRLLGWHPRDDLAHFWARRGLK